MKYSILLIIFLSCFQISAQNIFNPIESDTLDPKYLIDAKTLQEYIYSRAPENYKKDIYDKMSVQFSIETAYEISKEISGVNIYRNCSNLETYLNEILKKVLPENLKNEPFIHIYLIKNGDINAFMLPSGQIFLNVGILPEIEDEACLASILAHEVAHFYFNHSLQGYIAWRTGKYDLGLFAGNSDLLSNKYSIINELQADSMAMALMFKSGYNIKGSLSSFEIIERLEKNSRNQTENIYSKMESDHPLSEERFLNIQEFYTRHKDDTKSNFLVSQIFFNAIKNEAKQETIKCLSKNYELNLCIERAFKFHLLDPNNIFYIKHIMESIRKLCYVDNDYWKELFIANYYYKVAEINGVRTKKKMKDHLFVKFNNDVLCMSKEDSSKILALHYWNSEIKFTTNEEAFIYFYRLSLALGDKECILSNALSYTNKKDIEVRKEQIEKYLSYPDIEKREYAKCLLNLDSTMSSFNKKTLFVLNNVNVYIKLGKDKIPIQSFGSNTKEISCILDSISQKNKDFSCLYLKSLKSNNYNEFEKISILEGFSFRFIMSNKPKFTLLILEPDFYEIFKKYNVNEIMFANMKYFESHKPAKTTSESLSNYSLKYKDVLSKPFETKILEIYLSSTRINNNNSPNIKYSVESSNLDFKNTAYAEIPREFNFQLEIAKKRFKEFDINVKEYLDRQ